MISMDDSAYYHTLQTIAEHYCCIGLIQIDWPAQSLHLNFMKILWWIITLRVNANFHQIRSLKSVKEIIKEDWKKLMEKNFRAYTENMPK